MKFEFKPSDNTISFREYLRYLNKISPITSIYLKTIIPAFFIFMFFLITYALGYELSDYHTYFAYSIPLVLGFFIISIFIITLIFKVSRKIRLKNNIMRCDIESIYYFTIEDGYLIRENEFSYIKFKLNIVKEVKLLKHGLILTLENEKSLIFIPKSALPVTLEEFILLLKDENNSLVVIEEFKIWKKFFKKIYFFFAITLILTFICSFFISKYNYEHNFTKYDLISNSELIKQDNNTYLYENEDFGISLFFPSKWEGKFGIEEMEDRINVYYLVDGKQSRYTNLLFSIRGISGIFDTNDFNIIRTEALYMFMSPTTINLKENSDEHLEYLDLYKDIKNIELYQNEYFTI